MTLIGVYRCAYIQLTEFECDIVMDSDIEIFSDCDDYVNSTTEYSTSDEYELVTSDSTTETTDYCTVTTSFTNGTGLVCQQKGDRNLLEKKCNNATNDPR